MSIFSTYKPIHNCCGQNQPVVKFVLFLRLVQLFINHPLSLQNFLKILNNYFQMASYLGLQVKCLRSLA